MNRHMYITDPKQVNEDATRKQSFDKLKDGSEHCIVIHRHKDGVGCVLGVTHIRQQDELKTIRDTQCYMLTKESLGEGR